MLQKVKIKNHIDEPRIKITTDELGYVTLRAVIMMAGSMMYTKEEIFGDSPIPDSVRSEMVNGMLPVETSIEELDRLVYGYGCNGYDDTDRSGYNGKPLTNGHPDIDGMVTADLFITYAKGIVTRTSVFDGGIQAEFSIFDKDTIELINNGTVEVSGSYLSDLVIGQDGHIHSVNMVPDHVALVSRGRCGASCAIILNSISKDGIEMKVKLNNDSTVTIADDSVAQLVKADVEASKSKLDVKQALSDALAVKLEAANAEILELKDAELDEDAINKAVELRNNIISKLPQGTKAKGKTNCELVDIAIANNYPNLSLKDKSADYKNALFDSIAVGSSHQTNHQNPDDDDDDSGLTHEQNLMKLAYGKK